METIRRASHAGSWYTSNPQKLEGELDGWLRECGLTKSPDVRGVIAPHAGYSYSGRAAAYAFGSIDPTNITRIFLLGPSHHHYTPRCALSKATIYKTPIGDLPIDREVIEELKATGKFDMMDLNVDEAEHSMEMHLPYLAKVFSGFNYMHYDKKHGPIYKSIEALDKMGMEIIETGDPDEFKRYLSETDNTICGRHPISVFLHMSKNCSTKIKIKFIRYEQSSQCKSTRDSSVSYASAVAKLDH
ncbi:protein MEMO1 isoform X2 [Helianthus annuus]|uniref:protein MEMO1 isoform X2 n=1 Tax=Helianthus annuus TaxID=4232 RepID=UPI000B8F0C19|nr:protein MEMO1 isoform X2 [Helianthus annuus]